MQADRLGGSHGGEGGGHRPCGDQGGRRGGRSKKIYGVKADEALINAGF